MTTIYRYRKETHFAQPPEAIWPFLADTARLNEMAGAPPYQVADRLDPDGRTRRAATAKSGDREFDKRVAAVEKLVAEAKMPDQILGASAHEAATPAGQRRLDALIADLARDPASHGLAPKLAAHLQQAPGVTLRGIRPLTLARLWRAPPTDTTRWSCFSLRSTAAFWRWAGICCARAAAAPNRGSSVCTNCRKAPIARRAISTTSAISPATSSSPFVRSRGFARCRKASCACSGKPPRRTSSSRPKWRRVTYKSFALTLPPGAYRFRTVEAGGEADADIGADGIIPQVTASGSDISLAPSRHADELVVRNDTDRPLFFVVESRDWAQDALTGERVMAMPAFRRLCPEQLLRPGDDVEIGRVEIMFTDLQGSTKLYDDLGDATAYRLVRDHFAFLSERVQRHNGFVVKTVGDAVMAAFGDPADAVRAVLSIQDEVANFNRGRSDAGIVLKLGLHQGACIAVTVGGVLDYFGSVVNTAARLGHQCRGGEVIISEAVIADAEAREVLAGRALTQDSASLRGLSEPVRFVRVGAAVSQ